MENIRSLLNRVEVLPMSPSLLPKLLPYLGDVNGSFDEVVRIISFEQTLTAKLLQICNSAFFGQDEPVATVNEAVSRVGYQSVYLLTAMINSSGCFPQSSTVGFDAGKLWKHSVATAFYSKFVAESAGLDANLVFTAGLMHDIGKVVLAQAATEPGGCDFHKPTSPETLESEQLAFGSTHAVVGAALLEKWNLPPSLVACVRHHHDPQNAQTHQKIAACVAIGDSLAHGVEHPEITQGAAFTAALALLRLDSSHRQGWQEQFNASGDLIAGMCKLPR